MSRQSGDPIAYTNVTHDDWVLTEDMGTPPFGSIKCPACKGTGIAKYRDDAACPRCNGIGYILPKGEEVVKTASDAITPAVHDNPFSREALAKVMRAGADRSMRRVILDDLHTIYPAGLSSSQFEARYEWLHQSASAALTNLHQEGLVSVIGERTNGRGNREGVYSLSPQAKAAWDHA